MSSLFRARHSVGALSVARGRRLPAWAVALCLAVHLLAPALCLAQRLEAGLLGGICSAAPGALRGAETGPADTGAAQHAIEACDHCAGSAHAVVDTVAVPCAPAPRGAVLQAAGAPSPVPSGNAWWPPPRGPPQSA